jgi:DNA repair protein RecO (recombination protein O)
VPARTEHDDALVLRSLAYGEADRIVTLLTRRHGKVSALARSARKSKRRFAGSLEGFALIDAEIAIGSGELAQLRSARVTRAFPHLLADLERLNTGGALLRSSRELIPEHSADPGLFDELLGMLEALDRPDVPPAPLGICFEARLLALTGFAPLLSACGRCGKRPAAGRAGDFDPERGSLICQDCGGGALRIPGELRERLIAAMQGEVVSTAQAGWSSPDQQKAQRLLQSFRAHRLQKGPDEMV